MEQINQSAKLLSKDQVAEYLCCKPRTVLNLTNRQRRPLPFVQIGKAKMFRYESVMKWLDEEEKRGKERKQ